MTFLFVVLFIIIQLKCFGEKTIFLGETQSKIMDVAFEYFRNNANWNLLNTMIIDGAEDMHITFYCKSDSGETRGRGDMKIIYVN